MLNDEGPVIKPPSHFNQQQKDWFTQIVNSLGDSVTREEMVEMARYIPQAFTGGKSPVKSVAQTSSEAIGDEVNFTDYDLSPVIVDTTNIKKTGKGKKIFQASRTFQRLASH